MDDILNCKIIDKSPFSESKDTSMFLIETYSLPKEFIDKISNIHIKKLTIELLCFKPCSFNANEKSENDDEYVELRWIRDTFDVSIVIYSDYTSMLKTNIGSIKFEGPFCYNTIATEKDICEKLNQLYKID